MTNTAAAAEDDGFRQYSEGQIADILTDEDFDADSDISYISALRTHALVGTPEGFDHAVVTGFKSVGIMTLETYNYQTGVMFEVGSDPIIVLNLRQTLPTYETISALHPVRDSDVYIWADAPWEAQQKIHVYGDWFRRDVYHEYMPPYRGHLIQWPDFVITEEEGD